MYRRLRLESNKVRIRIRIRIRIVPKLTRTTEKLVFHTGNRWQTTLIHWYVVHMLISPSQPLTCYDLNLTTLNEL